MDSSTNTDLQWIFSGVTLALSTDTVASIVAQGGGRVVRSASGLEVTMEILATRKKKKIFSFPLKNLPSLVRSYQVLGIALASPPKVIRFTLTDATFVGAVSGALRRVFDVTLKNIHFQIQSHYFFFLSFSPDCLAFHNRIGTSFPSRPEPFH